MQLAACADHVQPNAMGCSCAIGYLHALLREWAAAKAALAPVRSGHFRPLAQ
jgi:hypothetical protein